MQLRNWLIYGLIFCATAFYGQTAVGLKVRTAGFHLWGINQDPILFENTISGDAKAIFEPGYELNFQKFIYSTLVSIELRQGFHSDAAARLAGHVALGLRWKFFHLKRSSFSISVAPLLSFRENWNVFPQYIDNENYKIKDKYQYKYLISSELIYSLYIGKRSDLSFAISYNNSYNAFAVSLGYRHWINPFVKVRDKNCDSCGGKRWNQGRFRKFWRRVWR